MRTTVDLDDSVLAAARSLASAKGISLGRAVSELALRGLMPREDSQRPLSSDASYSPFPVIHGETVITDELVAEHRDG